jgi:hypothetical protein
VTSPGTPATHGEPRFERGGQVTLLITAAVHSEYEVFRDGEVVPAVCLVPAGETAPILLDIAYERPGVTLVRGHILPTMRSALKHAVVMVEPVLGCEECALIPGTQCEPCAEDTRLRVEYGELLAALQGKSGSEGEAAQ